MNSQNEEWEIGRLIQWTKGYLADKGVDSPRLAAELLLAHALGCERLDLYTRYDEFPTSDQLSAYRESVKRVARHEPIAYLVGKKEFYSLEFEVTPAVLIPRPETEVLVEQAIRYGQALQQKKIDIIDLGTGSGCIGLAVCHYLQKAQVIGTELSESALAVARQNAARLGLVERFNTVLADGFDIPREVLPAGGFDMLLCNPPYVALQDMESLDPAVRAYEPREALFAGEDGLGFYRRIAAEAGAILKPHAQIFVEIGYDQHDLVVELLTAGNCYMHIESWRDHQEGHLRVIQFDYEG